jgi:NADH:ubiquinone oxidoreductase subunit 6 (subunit J)
MAGAATLAVALVVMVGIVVYLVATMVRSIRKECEDPKTSAWKHFSLSIVLCVLFLLSWAGQAVAQWQEFTDEQASHGQSVEIGDFAAVFSQATFENWQSEFLQLFSFVVLSALLIHKGSAESKDSDDRMEASLQRIEERLTALEQSPG